MSLYNSFGERVSVLPGPLPQGSQMLQSVARLPDFEYNSPKYTIDYSQGDNNMFGQDALQHDQKKMH
jgi:hypothetical protein